MSFCPLCMTEHPEGDAHCPAKSSAEKLGSAPTLYDAEPAAAPADPLIGKTLGHWMVVRKIGEGGMGIVYAAKEPVSGAQVAVKVLRLDEVNRITDLGFRQRCLDEAKERFRQEAEVARRLGENQPNIVQILGYGTLEDGRPYFVMEFLYGRSLESRMRQQPAPTREELRRWFEQACEALTVIHDSKVVHRDLKPDNIWIAEPKTGKSYAKLLDFGISKVQGGAALTSPGMVPGTVPYLAPERLSGSNDDPRSDIYAMGVILYEVFTGRVPFDGETIMHLYKMIITDPPPPLRVRTGLELTPKLEKLIFDCLAKRPEDRPQTTSDLKARVLEALDEEVASPARSSAQVPQPMPSSSGRETEAALAGMAKARRGRMGLLMGGVAVLAAAGAVAVRLSQPAPVPTPESAAVKSMPTPTAVVLPAEPAPTPSLSKPDAGTSLVRKPATRPRPGEKPVALRAPAVLQPEPLSPPPAMAAPTFTKPKPAPSSRPEGSPPAAKPAPPETESPPLQAGSREVLPSKPGKLSKPSKADIDLITNEQILLGN